MRRRKTRSRKDQPRRTTMQPYWVIDSAQLSRVSSGVAVIGRNQRLGMQVWSSIIGYPGDGAYREFHRKDSVSGLHYWRVTRRDLPLEAKRLYHPAHAAQRVESHAADFVRLVVEELQSYYGETGKFGLIACNYDTELFGHWWFEGVDWLKSVLRRLAAEPMVALTTAGEFVTQYPPEQSLKLAEGSWGAGGTHDTWDNHATRWMWEPIWKAEQRMERVVAQCGESHDPGVQTVLKQAARELLLLESSDWEFLITTGQAGEYAKRRFVSHLVRFEHLATSLEAGRPDTAAAAQLWELDRVFPEINPQNWKKR